MIPEIFRARRLARRSALIVIMLWLGAFALALHPAEAAGPGTAKDAIALAAQHGAFAGLLASHSGWKGAAYYTGNSNQIWRVQFWDSKGGDLGWADVSVARKKVYSWQAHSIPSDTQREAAKDALRKFATSNDDIKEVFGNFKDYDLYFDYNAEGGFWIVAVYRPGGDTVAALVTFPADDPFNFNHPTLKGIYFPEILPYDKWIEAHKSEAIAIAFTQSEVAAAVRSQDGWTASATPNDEDNTTWLVVFKAGDKKLAEATVDIEAHRVISFKVGGS